MLRFPTVLAAFFAAFLLNLFVSADADACLRLRHRHGCEIPCWVRCYEPSNVAHHMMGPPAPAPIPPPAPLVCCPMSDAPICWTFNGIRWILCGQGFPCEPGTFICQPNGVDPNSTIGVYGQEVRGMMRMRGQTAGAPHAAGCGPCTDARMFAMICDA